MAELYAVEITAYDPALAATRTLRYANRGMVTGSADTPGHTHYDERVMQAGSLRRDLTNHARARGRSAVGFGDVVLANGDGALDALLDYAVDGRAITIRRGAAGTAYPSAWTTVLVATMAGVDVNTETVTIKLRDRQQELEVPLQGTRYLGDNALPAGLEGVEDLKGKPKPLAYGKVRSIEPVLVNSAKLIYQAHDGALGSVDAVYDRGLSLSYGLKLASPYVNVAGGVSLTGVARGAGLWVVGVGNGDIYTSPDNVTWTLRTSNFGGDAVWNVAHNGVDLFVAVGGNGKLSSSPDGITWTARTSTFGTTSIFGIAYYNGLWVAVGAAGTMATSSNGTTWTSRTSSFGATDMQAVTGGASGYVAVGNSGKMAYSANGTTGWTQITSPFAAGDVVQGIGYSSLLKTYVCCGGGKIAYSADATQWGLAVHPIPAPGNFFVDAFWAGRQFIVSNSSSTWVWSADGVIWKAFPAGQAPTASNRGWYDAATGLFMHTIIGNASLSAAAAGTYNSTAELQDDTLAPPAGTWKVYLVGGYFRLGALPAGRITADVTQGAAASNRTVAQIFTALLTKGGKTSADWEAADITALDLAEDGVVGYYTGLDEVTVADVVDAVAASAGAWWGVDRMGKFRIKQLAAPGAPAVLKLGANDLLRPLARLVAFDPNVDLPVERFILRYQRHWTPLSATDLAAGVEGATRAQLALPWREVQSTAGGITGRWLLAPTLTEETLFDLAADALAEANRRQTLYGVQRDRFEAVIPYEDETLTLDLGDVVHLTHARFNLSAGRFLRVLRVEPDARARRLTLVLWG